MSQCQCHNNQTPQGQGACSSQQGDFVLSQAERDAIEHEKHHYEDPRAASIEALKIVQQARGWVPDGAIHAIAAELPDKQEQVVSVELSPQHRRLYDRYLARERQKVLGLVDDLARNRITRAIRGWLEAQDFLEIDPAALAVSPGNEAHLHAFETRQIGNDGVPRAMYLHTSPEFAMKKLLAAGEERIFSLSHVWRNRERGPLHSPEFTMLEWYRAGEAYDVLILATGSTARRLAGTGCRSLGRMACVSSATTCRARGTNCRPICITTMQIT